MTSLRCVLFGAVLVASVAPAHAEMKEIAKSGKWLAYAGRSDANQPMCSIGTKGKDWKVWFKWEDGVHFIQIYRQGWRVPSGTVIPLAVQFDENKPHNGNAKASIRVNTINAPIGDDIIKNVMTEFVDGSTMRVRFPNGSDHGWSIDLDGSEKVARAYTKCIVSFEKGNHSPQPHQGAAGTQEKGDDGI